MDSLQELIVEKNIEHIKEDIKDIKGSLKSMYRLIVALGIAVASAMGYLIVDISSIKQEMNAGFADMRTNMNGLECRMDSFEARLDSFEAKLDKVLAIQEKD